MALPKIPLVRPRTRNAHELANEILGSLINVQNFFEDLDAATEPALKAFSEMTEFDGDRFAARVEAAPDAAFVALRHKLRDLGLEVSDHVQFVADLQALAARVRDFQTWSRANVLPPGVPYAQEQVVDGKRTQVQQTVTKTVAMDAEIKKVVGAFER